MLQHTHEPYIGAKVALSEDRRGRVVAIRETELDVQVAARVKIDGSIRTPIYDFYRDRNGEIVTIPRDSVQFSHKYPS